MLKKAKAAWSVMQAGKMVADPTLWKTRQITANALAIFLLAVVESIRAFTGYELPITTEDAAVIAGAVLSIFNIVFTISTSEKVGLSPKP